MHTITGMVMLKSAKASGTNVEPFRGRRRSQKKDGVAKHDLYEWIFAMLK